MPDKSNDQFQFWQELKRRKVFRVIAMYAGTAYISIELVNNVAEPLHLPGWTATAVILLLIIGFPVIAILSWIFDFTPEGIQKTKPVSVNDEEIGPARRKLKISDGIIAVLLVLVIILAWPRIFNKDKLKNFRDEDGRVTVAVMPFENLTGDTTLNWFQRGISSLITNGLGSSQELIVRDERTLFEVTEGMGKVITAGISKSDSREIAIKVNAEICISGSFQGTGSIYRIIANLSDPENL